MNIRAPKLDRPAWLAGRGRLAPAGILATGLAIGGIGFGATADAVPTGAQVRCPGTSGSTATVCYPLDRNSVASGQVVDNSLISNDLHPSVRAAINSKTGQVTELEADGPYPGATDLGDLEGQGDNSDAQVPNDSEPHTVWVQCAPGKVALGGGFRLAADASVAAMKTVQVVASEPAQIKDGELVVVPIEGDAAQSIEPNGWAVTAINEGTVVVIVRPWVTCAKVAK